MTEVSKPAEHRDLQDFEGPALRNWLVPHPAATLPVRCAGAGVEDGVRLQPTAWLEHRLPHGLWLRPVHQKSAEPLELAPMATVEERVVSKASGGDDAQADCALRRRRPAFARTRRFSPAWFAAPACGRHGWPLNKDACAPASNSSPMMMRS